MSILDSVPATVAAAISAANVFYDGTLQRAAARVPDGRGGFTLSGDTEPIKYIVFDYSDYIRARGNIPPNERKMMLLADGLTGAPMGEDKITDKDAKTWTIVNVTADPAQATYECRVR